MKQMIAIHLIKEYDHYHPMISAFVHQIFIAQTYVVILHYTFCDGLIGKVSLNNGS